MKKDIKQLELDLVASTERVEVLKQTIQQMKLDLREEKVKRKSIKREIVLARSKSLQKEEGDKVLRDRIRRNVVGYCLSEGISCSAAWTYLYDLLKSKTGVNPFELGLGSRESRLEHVQKAGLLSNLLKLLPELEALKPCK